MIRTAAASAAWIEYFQWASPPPTKTNSNNNNYFSNNIKRQRNNRKCFTSYSVSIGFAYNSNMKCINHEECTKYTKCIVLLASEVLWRRWSVYGDTLYMRTMCKWYILRRNLLFFFAYFLRRFLFSSVHASLSYSHYIASSFFLFSCALVSCPTWRCSSTIIHSTKIANTMKRISLHWQWRFDCAMSDICALFHIWHVSFIGNIARIHLDNMLYGSLSVNIFNENLCFLNQIKTL